MAFNIWNLSIPTPRLLFISPLCYLFDSSCRLIPFIGHNYEIFLLTMDKGKTHD